MARRLAHKASVIGVVCRAVLVQSLGIGFLASLSIGGSWVSQADSGVQTLEPGVLKVCLYAGFAPFTSKNENGEWTGWDVDYLRRFAAIAGLRLQSVEVASFDGIWEEPGRGTCDIAASGISDTRDRRASSGTQAEWSQHYYSVLRAFLVREGDTRNLNSIDDLRDRTVIVTANSTADNDIRTRLARAGITTTTIVTTTSEMDAAQQVLNGNAFAYGGGLGSVQYLASQVGGLAVAWPHCNMLANGSEVGEPFSFVVRSGSAGVLEALNRFIADTTYEGQSATDPGCPAPSTG